MDLRDIQWMFPIVLKLLLSVAMKQRQTDAILIKTYLISLGVKSVVAVRARVRAWVKKAEETRSSTTTGQIDTEMAKIGTISVA
eukprot:9495694-Pyramimonas_sp.AAC.1